MRWRNLSGLLFRSMHDTSQEVDILCNPPHPHLQHTAQNSTLTCYISVLAKSSGWLTVSFPWCILFSFSLHPLFITVTPLSGHGVFRFPRRGKGTGQHTLLLSIHFDFVTNVFLDGLPPFTSQLWFHNFKIKAQAPRRINPKGHCSALLSYTLSDWGL